MMYSTNFQSTTNEEMTTGERVPNISYDYNYSSSIGVNFTTRPPSITTVAPKSLDFTWVEYFGMVSSLVILIVGVVGNLLTIIIMRRKPFLASSACVYLPCMALFDSMHLITGIPYEWISWFQIDIDSWSCRFHRFFFFGSGDMSIWILVAFTFDRFVAVCFPFKKRFFCEPRKAAITVGGCILLGIIKNAHLFWTRGLEMKNGVIVRSCGQVEDYYHFEKFIRPWIVLICVSILPFCSIIIFNAAIVHQLIKSKRSRPDAFSGRQSKISSNKASVKGGRETVYSKSGTETNKDSKGFYQTTAMCLSVSFGFLILIAPSIVIQIGKPYWKKKSLFDTFRTISIMLGYLNHAINFCLYCLTGVRFRAELQVLCGKKVKRSYSIFSGLSPRFSSTQQRSVMMSDIKSSTVSTDSNEGQGFADAAIALALAKEST